MAAVGKKPLAPISKESETSGSFNGRLKNVCDHFDKNPIFMELLPHNCEGKLLSLKVNYHNNKIRVFEEIADSIISLSITLNK